MPDIIDRASEQEERHRAWSLLEHAARRQRECAEAAPPARRRACADCGDPIPPRRLRALPQTTRCTPCQARQERC